MSRLRRFLSHARALRRLGFRMNYPNLRAMWIQSDPLWLSKLPPLDLTDAEFDEFMDALR